MFMSATIEAFPSNAGGPFLYRAVVDGVRTKAEVGVANASAALNAVKTLVGTAMSGAVTGVKLEVHSVTGKKVAGAFEAYPTNAGGPFAYRVSVDNASVKTATGLATAASAFDAIRDQLAVELQGDSVLWARADVVTNG